MYWSYAILVVNADYRQTSWPYWSQSSHSGTTQRAKYHQANVLPLVDL